MATLHGMRFATNHTRVPSLPCFCFIFPPLYSSSRDYSNYLLFDFFYCCFLYPCSYCPIYIYFLLHIHIYYRRNVTPRRARTTITTLVTIINDVSYSIYGVYELILLLLCFIRRACIIHGLSYVRRAIGTSV